MKVQGEYACVLVITHLNNLVTSTGTKRGHGSKITWILQSTKDDREAKVKIKLVDNKNFYAQDLENCIYYSGLSSIRIKA